MQGWRRGAGGGAELRASIWAAGGGSSVWRCTSLEQHLAQPRPHCSCTHLLLLAPEHDASPANPYFLRFCFHAATTPQAHEGKVRPDLFISLSVDWSLKGVQRLQRMIPWGCSVVNNANDASSNMKLKTLRFASRMNVLHTFLLRKSKRFPSDTCIGREVHKFNHKSPSIKAASRQN